MSKKLTEVMDNILMIRELAKSSVDLTDFDRFVADFNLKPKNNSDVVLVRATYVWRNYEAWCREQDLHIATPSTLGKAFKALDFKAGHRQWGKTYHISTDHNLDLSKKITGPRKKK